MNSRLLSIALAVTSLAAAHGADDKDAKVTAHEALNSRILEENAKKQGAPAMAPAKAKDEKTSSEKSKSQKAEPAPAAAPATTGTEKAKQEPATVLPKVEVNRSRVNELNGMIVEQEKEIAREKQNARPTEIDKALNNPKVSKALSIFGGESSSQRATVASERVKIMEEERELLEATKTAKTTDEKAGLQKELDALRAYRRELEKGLR